MAIAGIILLGVGGFAALVFFAGVIDCELEQRRRKNNKGE
ncbi:unnamed protein product [marine sediment metagenome]|uniref:Uncharacterized protein n=1 Tax=marine sediment metagenome TaxID=412755 RepID=X1PWS1_9ZZZZ